MASDGFFGSNVETIVVRTVYEGNDMQRAGNEFKVTAKKMGKGMVEFTKTTTNAKGKVTAMTKEIQKQKQVFPGWALTMMFAGMQITKSMETITKSSTQMFLQLEKGQTEAGRALVGLSAAWQFLTFSVGQAIGTALAPLIPYLVEFINWVSATIQKHPLLTATLIGTLTVLGGILLIGSQIVLFLKALGSAELVAGLGMVGDAFAAIGTAVTTVILPLLVLVGIIVGIIAMLKFLAMIGPATFQVLKDYLQLAGNAFLEFFTGLEIRSQQMQLALKAVWLMIEIAWTQYVINPIKEGFAGMLNWVIDKANSFVKKLANSLGSWAPEWMKNFSLGHVTVDTTSNLADLQKQLAGVTQQYTDWDKAMANMHSDFAMQNTNLIADASKNGQVGLDQASQWKTDLLNLFGLKSGANGAVTTNQASTTNTTNNIGTIVIQNNTPTTTGSDLLNLNLVTRTT